MSSMERDLEKSYQASTNYKEGAIMLGESLNRAMVLSSASTARQWVQWGEKNIEDQAALSTEKLIFTAGKT